MLRGLPRNSINMARRGRDRGGQYKGYVDHDDRVGGGFHNNDGSRRVSFKNQQREHRNNRNNRNRQQGFDTKHIRSLIMSNNDIDMGGHYSQKPNSDNKTGMERGGPEPLSSLDGESVSDGSEADSGSTVEPRHSEVQGTSEKIHSNVRSKTDFSNRVGSSSIFGFSRVGKFEHLFTNHGTLKVRGKRTLKFMPNCFYRVEIRYGSRYDKDYLLKVLASHINPTPLIPLGCKTNNNDFVFTLTDHSTAEKILNSNRAVTLKDGWKLALSVRPYSPLVEIDEKLTIAIKAALASRFKAETKSLDLTTFQEDAAFLTEQLICPLNRANVMSFVIELVSESVPDLVALNLNKNGISAIEHLKILIDKLPNLRILHMAHNSIREVKQLDHLKGLKLDEINLDGNTLASQFNSKEDYIREIRKRFPKVIKLDEVDLPKPITFDLEEDDAGHLPKSQLSFMCDAEHGSVMARTFIEQYYHIFDSDDRSPLIQAYHETAHFSLMCHINTSSDSHSMFSNFLPDNRNLLKYNGSEKRLKLLKVGKHSIVEGLKNFPGTEHDPTTFVVDLVFFTPALIQLIVSGLFREKIKPTSGSPIKFFSRTFIIVPVGSGFCIVNEEVCLHYPTSAQIKQMASKPKAPVPAMATPEQSQVASQVAPNMTSVVNGVSPDILAKQQMVTDFAAKSGMNLIWSEKCLTETNWNLEQAMFAFTQLREAGTIPMEAFQNY